MTPFVDVVEIERMLEAGQFGAPDVVRSLLSALKAERERTGKMEAVLRAYEQWDADVILTNECWRNAMPTLTQELYDHWIEIAEQRNAALGDRT